MKGNIMRKIVPPIIIVLLLLFFLIATGIFPVSLERAVKNKRWNSPFRTAILEKNSALLFIEEGKGEIRLASAREGIFGWKIVDHTELLSATYDIESFISVEGSLSIKKNKKLHYLLGLINDDKISHMTYKAATSAEEQDLYRMIGLKGTVLYY